MPLISAPARFEHMATSSPSSARLLIGGGATFLLVTWVASVPGTLPRFIADPRHAPDAGRMSVSALLCVFAIVPLAVAVVRGPGGLRIVSALALIFPTLVLLWILLGNSAR